MTMKCPMPMLLLVSLLGMISQTFTLSFMSGAQDDQTVGVDVSLMHSSHTREKRSAAQLPDILHFRFNLEGTTIELKLSQSSRQIEAVPVFYKQEGGAFKRHDVPNDENVAVFRDPSRGSVVVVKRSGDQEYLMAGNFHHGERLYQIWPQTGELDLSRPEDLKNGHSVRRVKQYNLNNDARLLEVVKVVQAAPGAKGLENHRQKRQATTTEYIIEIGAFPDFSDYYFFLTEAGNNVDTALSNMRTYYAFIEQSMQMRFDTVNAQDESIKIRVLFKYITTATSADLSPWTEDIRRGTLVADEPALNDFTSFIQDGSNSVTSADHYIAFTRLDLEYDGNTAVAGLAFLGSLCTSSATSIVENTFDGFTAALAAHEVGHSLNARHDTDEGCNDEDNFIMSPKLTMPTENNPSRLWTFSSCSVAVFKAFLNTPSGQCSLATTIANGLSDGSQIAGQETDADKQCARIVGSGSKFCRTSYTQGNKFDAICQTLKCSGTDGDVNTCDDFVAYEGTSCGNGKWCEKGMCMSADAAPSRPENCPQGDDPDFACQQSSCSSYSSSQRLLCCSSCSSASNNNNNSTNIDNNNNDNEILQVGHSSTVMTTPAVMTTTPFVSVTTVERFIVTLCYYRPPFHG